MSYTIKTDHKWRNFLYGYDLTAKELKEFDYIPSKDIETSMFFRYRGHCYDVNEFMGLGCLPEDSPLKGWYVYLGDSFFSGIVIRFSKDYEQYQVGRF
jgi:hypothetical protein